MSNFQSEIFGYFGSYEKLTDTYKDANGKGVLERFNEVVGKDMDRTVLAIESLVANYTDLYTASLFELKLISANNGVSYPLVYAGSDIETVRRIAKYAKNIVEWRGSLAGARLITYIILPPTSVTVTEDFSDYTLDSGTTLDSPVRRLDSGGNFTNLIFNYVNTSIVSEQDKETLRRITAYNTPFDCISRTRLNEAFI
jgi:hypothetical protein